MDSVPNVSIRLRPSPAARQVPTEVVRAHLMIGHDFDRDASCKALADRVGVGWQQLMAGLGVLQASALVNPEVSWAVIHAAAHVMKEVTTAIEVACNAAGPPTDEPLRTEVMVRQDLEH